MKLLGISIGSLVVVAMVWGTLYFWGQGLKYQPYEHPMMNVTSLTTALAANSPGEAQDFLKKNPDSPIMVSLHVSSDGEFFTADDADLEFPKQVLEKQVEQYRGPKHYSYTFAQIQSNSPHIISLQTWVQNANPKFWIFDIQDNAQNVDKQLIAWIEKNKLQDKVIITSPIDLVLTAIKNERPLWVMGSSLSDLNKLLTLASIHLENIANFKRDYYFTPVTLLNRDVLNQSVIAEVKRRFKKVAIGPVHTDQDRERALSFSPDILIIGADLANK